MRADEFERIYAAHAPGVLAFLASRSGDRALAEDLAAEAFERVYRARLRFDHRKASEKTWVYAVALNCLRDHLRRERSAQSALDRLGQEREALDDSSLDRIGDRDALGRAMRALSDEEREVVALRAAADLTVPEIARVLGISRTTAEGRLYGGLRKLRAELESDPTPGPGARR
jgi:RNA polymerase sigma-70 factor (ECF subfamily)